MLEKIGDDGLENGVGKSQSFWQKKLDVLIADLQKEKSDLAGRRSKGFYSKIDWRETIAHLSVWLVLLEKMKKENCIEEIKSTMQREWVMNQDLFSQSEGKMKIVEGIVGRVEEWLEIYPWHPSRPLRELPPEIRKIFTDMAKYLLDNLNTQGLVVELIPAPEPKFDSHKIRVVRQSNPGWYRDLYGSNSHIRRDCSKLSLERLYKEKDLSYHSYGHNDTIYRQLIFEMLVNGCRIKDVDFEPNKEVRKYFGLEVTLDNDDSTTCRGDISCDDDEHEYDNIEEVFITRKLEFCDDEPYEDVPF